MHADLTVHVLQRGFRVHAVHEDTERAWHRDLVVDPAAGGAANLVGLQPHHVRRPADADVHAARMRRGDAHARLVPGAHAYGTPVHVYAEAAAGLDGERGVRLLSIRPRPARVGR